MPRGATPGRVPRQGGSDRLLGAWWWTLRTVDPDVTVRLIGVIEGLPNLHGAACQGHHQLTTSCTRTWRSRVRCCDRSGWRESRGCAVAARHGHPAPLSDPQPGEELRAAKNFTHPTDWRMCTS
jgi:hypothetical protein